MNLLPAPFVRDVVKLKGCLLEILEESLEEVPEEVLEDVLQGVHATAKCRRPLLQESGSVP